MSVKIDDFIAAPNSGGDFTKVLLVVHVTVSPEVAGGARNVIADWNRRRAAGVPTGSTQYVVDNREIIQSVRERAYAWAAGTTANEWGIHVEHVGMIQTLRQWRDDYSTAELELSAPLFAELGAKHGIPLRRIGPDQVRKAVASGDPAQGGICGHIDITRAFPGETTHTDPGTFFPWSHFMRLVKAAEEDDMPLNDADKKWIRKTIREEAEKAVDAVLEVDMNALEPKGSPRFRGVSLRGAIKGIYNHVVPQGEGEGDGSPRA